MSSLRMISIAILLDRGRKRHQSDVARLLDGFGQSPLMGSADSGDAARRDLATLGDERVEELHFLVVDVVDPLDAEAADFLAPEILFLGRDGLVATGRTLGCGYGPSTFAFRHIVSPL